VGRKTTPNSTKQAAAAIESYKSPNQRPVSGIGSPHQFRNCPWCGSPINPGQHIVVELYPAGRARTITYCGDSLGQCEQCIFMLELFAKLMNRTVVLFGL